MRKRTVIILCTFVIIALAWVGLYEYQTTRFNAHVTINGTEVGGLTAKQAVKKLEAAVSKNIVYVGPKQIYDGKDTNMGFTNKDLPEVKKLLRKQWTLFPSLKEKNYTLLPNKADHAKSLAVKKKLEEKLVSMNKSLKAPKDAEVQIEQDKIVVSESEKGDQYDIARLLKEYQKQEGDSEIHLIPVYLQPITADSPEIQKGKRLLADLLQRSVEYKLQDKPYQFNAGDILKSASVSKDMKVTMSVDIEVIKNKLKAMNQTLSTLGKNYTFKTHSGSVISVKGESYGWAINIDAEAKRIQEAFLKGEKAILAYNIYGVGWNVNGVGYHNPTNHGIGDTYVEVSIDEQRIWVYKNGQLMVTTRVVTGRHDTHEDTPKGVWYIEYKESPSILQGSEVGNPNYSVKVNYWAPFTLGGAGLHDAGWRTNWAMDAYLHHGSGGCVNTPPSVMKTVYDHLTQYEPVVVY